MIVILPCTVNLEYSFHELVAEIVAHPGNLTKEEDHRIAQHDSVCGEYLPILAYPWRFSEHWMMFMPDQAES